MLHTKHQGSRPWDFRKEEFSCFSYRNLCKTCDPQGWPILGPRGLNKLGRGLLDEATYQISSLEALWFLTRRFLKILSQKSIFSLCDMDMQQTRTS